MSSDRLASASLRNEDLNSESQPQPRAESETETETETETEPVTEPKAELENGSEARASGAEVEGKDETGGEGDGPVSLPPSYRRVSECAEDSGEKEKAEGGVNLTDRSDPVDFESVRRSCLISGLYERAGVQCVLESRRLLKLSDSNDFVKNAAARRRRLVWDHRAKLALEKCQNAAATAVTLVDSGRAFGPRKGGLHAALERFYAELGKIPPEPQAQGFSLKRGLGSEAAPEEEARPLWWGPLRVVCEEVPNSDALFTQAEVGGLAVDFESVFRAFLNWRSLRNQRALDYRARALARLKKLAAEKHKRKQRLLAIKGDTTAAPDFGDGTMKDIEKKDEPEIDTNDPEIRQKLTAPECDYVEFLSTYVFSKHIDPLTLSHNVSPHNLLLEFPSNLTSSTPTTKYSTEKLEGKLIEDAKMGFGDVFENVPKHCKFQDPDYKALLDSLLTSSRDFFHRIFVFIDEDRRKRLVSSNFDFLWDQAQLHRDQGEDQDGDQKVGNEMGIGNLAGGEGTAEVVRRWQRERVRDSPQYAVATGKMFGSVAACAGHKVSKKYLKVLSKMTEADLRGRERECEEEEKRCARLEFEAAWLLQRLAPQIHNALERARRREARTYAESIEEAKREAAADPYNVPVATELSRIASRIFDRDGYEDEEEGKAKKGYKDGGEDGRGVGGVEAEEREEMKRKQISNPLNLPLDFDGQPIPVWLYKLHGLSREFECEICGNYRYRGRKAFELHFSEWRHAYGMKCLGLPNTVHFQQVTKIADAIAIHEKLKQDLAAKVFDPRAEIEIEDDQGRILPPLPAPVERPLTPTPPPIVAPIISPLPIAPILSAQPPANLPPFGVPPFSPNFVPISYVPPERRVPVSTSIAPVLPVPSGGVMPLGIVNLGLLTPGLLPAAPPGPIPAPIPGVLPAPVPGLLPGVLPGLLPEVLPGVLPGVIPGVLPEVLPGVLPGVTPPGHSKPAGKR